MAFELKRFWKNAVVEETSVGFGVSLDGRSVKTPLKRPLILPSAALAAEVAAEWQMIEGIVDFHKMPFTRFAHAGIDQSIDERAEISAKVALYGETDLLCYRAESPQELVMRQANAWDPLLSWSAESLAAPLTATSGIVHVAQPAASLAKLKEEVNRFETFALTALYDWVTISGSLVLGLAVAKGRLGAAEAWALSRIDETWQEEQWGMDDEAEKLAESKRKTFLLVERALGLMA